MFDKEDWAYIGKGLVFLAYISVAASLFFGGVPWLLFVLLGAWGVVFTMPVILFVALVLGVGLSIGGILIKEALFG